MVWPPSRLACAKETRADLGGDCLGEWFHRERRRCIDCGRRIMVLLSMARSQAISRAMTSNFSKKRQSEVPEFVEVVIEVPKGSFEKRRPDGTVDFMVPVPCPFNYGSVHSIPAPDGDPLDAIVLGEGLPYGHKGTCKVKGLLRFIDAGVVDNKLVCVQPSKICKPCFNYNSKRECFKTIGEPKLVLTQHLEETLENGFNEDISLLDWLSLSCIFSGYALWKGGLNLSRGKHGSTSFNGLEVYG